jgi:hypothetical protein
MITYFIETRMIDSTRGRSRRIVKIGKTVNLSARLRTIRTSIPDATLLGQLDGDFEGYLHTKFAHLLAWESREWFWLDKELADYVRSNSGVKRHLRSDPNLRRKNKESLLTIDVAAASLQMSTKQFRSIYENFFPIQREQVCRSHLAQFLKKAQRGS